MKTLPEAGLTLDFRRITLGNLISLGAALAAITASYYHLKSEVVAARNEIAVVQNDIAWIKQTMSAKGIPAIVKNP